MPINKKETSKIINLEIPKSIKGEDRQTLLDDIGEYLLAEIINSVESGVSPIDGEGRFKKLSKKYANAQKNSDTTANLDLHGDMLDSLTYKVVGTNKIKVGIFDKKQAVKSYNHNVGDTLPRRPFIPNTKESYDRNIMKGIDDLIQEVLDANQ